MLNLEADEKIILVARKHWFVFVTEVAVLVFLAVAPPVAYFSLDTWAGWEIAWITPFWPLAIFTYALFLLFLWVVSFVFWTDYYLDAWVITDKKIIDVEQRGLFARDVATLRLENIQDVKVVIAGFIYTLLDLGDIHVQTASRDKEFILPGARHPQEAKRVLLSAQTKKLEEIKTVRLARVL